MKWNEMKTVIKGKWPVPYILWWDFRFQPNLYQYGLSNSVKEPQRLNQVKRVWDLGWGWWSVGKRKQGEEGVRPEDGQGERQTDRRQTPTEQRYSTGRLWLSQVIWVAGNEAAYKAEGDKNSIRLTKIWINKDLFWW